MVLSNNDLIVAGGTSGPGSSFNDVYKMHGGLWYPLPFSNPNWSPRSDFAMVALRNGTVVLAGGQNEDGGDASLNDVWAMDPDTHTFHKMPDAPWKHRVGHSMSVCAGAGGSAERIVLTGGGNTRAGVFIWQYNDVWAMSGDGTWSSLGDAPWHKRWLHGTVCLSDGTVLLAGGHSGFQEFNDVWSMSHDGKWTELSPAAPWSTRAGFGMVALPGDLVIVGPDEGREDAWALDWSSGKTSWQSLGKVPFSDRGGYGIAPAPNGTKSALIAGGTLLSQGIHNYNEVWQISLEDSFLTV